jgi:myo-inositol-1-phosphate synthase
MKPLRSKKIEKYALTELEEEYVLMYHEYFVLKWTWNEICKKHICERSKVKDALRWVIENKINIPSSYLIKGAIDSFASRIKINKELYDKEVAKQRYRDNSFVIALTKELREDEKTIFKLQEIYQDPEDTNNTSLTPAQTLALIKATQKEDAKG